MGICPQKFGPYYWGTLHLACLYAADSATLKNFVDNFTGVLPCPACRIHFNKVLEMFPFPDQGTREDFFKWSVLVHNVVNERLGKPQISHDEAFDIWTSGCDYEPPFFDFKFWLMFVALVGLFIFLYMNK